MKTLQFILISTYLLLFPLTGIAEQSGPPQLFDEDPYSIIQAAIFLLIFIGFPVYSKCVDKCSKAKEQTVYRGLNLPRGSVRSMLALLIVGSYINFLMFGSAFFEDQFDKILAAFGTLAGAVTGFYFAGRIAQKSEDLKK